MRNQMMTDFEKECSEAEKELLKSFRGTDFREMYDWVLDFFVDADIDGLSIFNESLKRSGLEYV